MKLRETLDAGGVYVIAEMSANHAGSLDYALELVRAAARSGADCLKIQTYTADTITMDHDGEPFRLKGGLWDKRRLYELYQEAHTPWAWHGAIRDECQRQGLDFLSTPFDATAVDFLEELGVEFYKIASFELPDLPLLRYTASKGKPIILSCGMGNITEIVQALDTCLAAGLGRQDIVLLKCTSDYPACPEDMNLRTLLDLRQRFGVQVGLSDHSMGSAAAVSAVALGAKVVEKHFCISRSVENPDAAFSMEEAEFAAMVQDIRMARRALGSATYRLTSGEVSSTATRRSLFVAADTACGQAFTGENLRSIRPGQGLKPRFLPWILGSKAARDLPRGTPLSWAAVDPQVQLRLKEESILSPRLRLDGMTQNDAEQVVEWRSRPDYYQYFRTPRPLTLEEHLTWLDTYAQDPTRLEFTVRVQSTGKKIGVVSLQGIDYLTGQAEVYYLIGEEQGTGYGTEAVWALCDYARRDLRLTEITATVHPDNLASRHLVEKLGFVAQEQDSWLVYRRSLEGL